MAREIEEELYRLAGVAWSVRRIVLNSDFILHTERLPRPDSANDMEAVVEHLYVHARKWAPGFEIPYRVPKVRLSPLITSAGQYTADSHGYLFIDVAPEFKGQHSALFAILAHEACHHILDLSGLHGATREDGERLTDLTTFICGFGELILRGHSHIRRGPSGWTTVHLGYLSSADYRSAQNWVLKAQGLQASASPAEASPGLVARISSWFTGRASSVRERPRPPAQSLIDVTAQRRKVALARLGGDRALLDRLIEYERGRQPSANELMLLDAVIESLERDRR